MNPNIVIIIQARMGSSRLLNKMFKPLKGVPVIEWVVTRCKNSTLASSILVAIPENEENDVLYEYLQKLGVTVFRGSENDVLDRFYKAAKEAKADLIVRVCADNPLVCGSELDALIEFYLRNDYDYVYNHIPKGNLYPDGLGGEIMSFNLLEFSWNNAISARNREHCFTYVSENSNEFRIATFDPLDSRIQAPQIKLDVDTSNDLAYLEEHNIRIDMNAIEIVEEFNR